MKSNFLDRFGEKVKKSFAECERNVKNWTKSDWERSGKEFDAICRELAKLIENQFSASSREVQGVVRQHYQWLKRFWTPTKESYPGHGRLIVETDLRKPYVAHHPQLPQFIAEAMLIFAKKELA